MMYISGGMNWQLIRLESPSSCYPCLWDSLHTRLPWLDNNRLRCSLDSLMTSRKKIRQNYKALWIAGSLLVTCLILEAPSCLSKMISFREEGLSIMFSVSCSTLQGCMLFRAQKGQWWWRQCLCSEKRQWLDIVISSGFQYDAGIV